MARDCGFCFYVRKCGLMIWLRNFLLYYETDESNVSSYFCLPLFKVVSVENVVESNYSNYQIQEYQKHLVKIQMLYLSF